MTKLVKKIDDDYYKFDFDSMTVYFHDCYYPIKIEDSHVSKLGRFRYLVNGGWLYSPNMNKWAKIRYGEYLVERYLLKDSDNTEQ